MKGMIFMFDKKYKKTLEILDDEIETYNRLFHLYLKLADSNAMNEESKKWHLDRAREYQVICIELSDLKTKIHREIES